MQSIIGQGRADLDDGRVLAIRHFCEDRAHEARIGHEAIHILVVLIGADAVHARFCRIYELVES
jgi:hypothetical protein